MNDLQLMLHAPLAFLSPIDYGKVPAERLKTALLINALLMLAIATVAAVSWVRLPGPKPGLFSYAGAVHGLLFLGAGIASVACFLGYLSL